MNWVSTTSASAQRQERDGRSLRTGRSAVVDSFGDRLHSVSAGRSFTVALTASGDIIGWGDNSIGALGAGTTSRADGPVRVRLPGGVGASQLSARWGTVYALGSDGRIYAWGDNSYGQLGQRRTPFSPGPVEVPLPGGLRFVRVEAGMWHALAISRSGQLLAWGDNACGQLGTGTNDVATVPVVVALSGRQVVTDISAGGQHSLAVTADGTVLAWGDNSFGQLGDGTRAASPLPMPVSLPGGVRCVQVAALGNASLALTTDGEVFAWGENAFGQLGDGSTSDRPEPVRASFPDGVRIQRISGGTVHAVALDDSGLVYLAGRGVSTTGRTDGLASHLVPTLVSVPGYPAFAALACGFAHSAGITVAGRLICWGANWSGQLAMPEPATPVGVAEAPVVAHLPIPDRYAEVARLALESPESEWDLEPVSAER